MSVCSSVVFNSGGIVRRPNIPQPKLLPRTPYVLNWVQFEKKNMFLWKIKIKQKWKKPPEREKWDLSNGTWFACIFLSKHEEKWGESYMRQTPLCATLTDTEYVCPLIGPLNHAHHGANSAALLPGWICRIDSCAFAAMGWADGWFGIDIEWRSIDLHLINAVLTLFRGSIPPNCPSLLSPPPQTVHISWLLPWMGGAALASVLHVAGCPLPSQCCLLGWSSL